MKKEKKFVIAAIVLIVVAVLVVVGVILIRNNNKNNQIQDNSSDINNPNNENKDNVIISDDGTKTNNSSKLTENKMYDDLKITNISLSAKSGTTAFNASVINDTNTDKEGRPIVIVFLSENGNEINRMNAYISQVKKGNSTNISASTTSDMSNAYDFRIENK